MADAAANEITQNSKLNMQILMKKIYTFKNGNRRLSSNKNGEFHVVTVQSQTVSGRQSPR